MGSLKAGVKLARALWHILTGYLTILLVFPRLTPQAREARIQAWSAKMLDCIGIQLRVQGPANLGGPLLLVANHISWLDITSLHAARFCRFVSKADIKHWPVIGTLAIGVGTLFIERASRRDAMRVVHHMTDRLQQGDVIGVFPEGTTSDGTGMLPFHANLLQGAIAAGVSVQPVAIQFIDTATGLRSPAPCYIDDDTLIGSVWRTLSASGIAVLITFGEPQRADGRDRREWAHALRDAVAALRQK
ncbi:MAG: lysophospholipid acyltransferase family protein [Pseudomonadota bacterium]